MIAPPEDVILPVWEIAAADEEAVVGGVSTQFQWMSAEKTFWRLAQDFEVIGIGNFSTGDVKLSPIPGKPGMVGVSSGFGFELDMPASVARTLWEGYTFEILPASGDCHPPFGVLRTAYAADGTAYAADEYAIWRMDDDKVARLIAGTPCVEFGPGTPPVPGPAVGAPVPMGNDHGYGTNVIVEPWLYITNILWDVIARVDLDRGTIEEWDRPTPPFYPGDIERGPRGELYLVDASGACVWVVEPDGGARVFAGTCGSPGSSGDGGPADEAQFEYISSITIDPAGYLYICDPYAENIRRVLLAP